MRKPRKFYRRLFLNDRGFEAGAHIISEVSCDERAWDARREDGKEVTPAGHRRSVETTFEISDCGRIVNLTFYTDAATNEEQSDRDTRNNCRVKAYRLRREVNDFVAKYLEALDWAEEILDDRE